MVVGTLSLVQKGQTSGRSGIVVYGGGNIVFGAKGQTSGHSGCSGKVAYGGGDTTGLTFLHQRQCSHHHIQLFHCIHCVLCPLQTASTGLTFMHQRQCSHHHKPLIPLHPLCTVSTAYCVHWFDPFAPKTMSPPPYTTIPLHSLHTVTTIP